MSFLQNKSGLRKALALGLGLAVLIAAVLLRPPWKTVPGPKPVGDPQVAGPLLQGPGVEYRFRSPFAALAGVDVRWATYARANASTLILELRRARDMKLVASTRMPVAGFIDWGFRKWRFEPVEEAQGQEFILTLLTPDATPETCLAVLTTGRDEPEKLSFSLSGGPAPGSLPVRLVEARFVWPWASPWVYLGLLAGICLGWLVWPVRPPGPVPGPEPAPLRTWILVAVGLTLIISFGCGWTNIVEKGMVERAGYHFSPTPGDENWYAELAHKIGLGKRLFRGDYQAYEAKEVLTPYTAVILPLGLLGLGDRLLGPVVLGYAIDFLLPALMVLMFILAARRLGASLKMAAVMGTALIAFPHLATFYLTGARSVAGALGILWHYLRVPGTYFTQMGHPQASGLFAVWSGLALWRIQSRGGRLWTLLAGLSLGSLFYTDLFFQHIIVGSAGILWLAALLHFDWPRFRRLTVVLVLAFLVGLPYWINTLFFNLQPWAWQYNLDLTDSTPVWTWYLQRFEIVTLALVGVLFLVYLALILRRMINPAWKEVVPDWALDATFAPVWAFAIVFMANQITGINPQKHHYFWRGLSVWLPLASTGWLWWFLERKARSGAARLGLTLLTVLVVAACLFKIAPWADFLRSPDYPTGVRPPFVSAIRPGMHQVLAYLDQEAGPDDVVLTLDYEQIKHVNTHTGCYTYIQTCYNSVLLNRAKAERIGWGFALLGSKISPTDYLDYTVNGLEGRENTARGRMLKDTFGGFLIAVWAPFGPRYHLSAVKAIQTSGRVYDRVRGRNPSPEVSPYRLDWAVVGPLEKRLGADLSGKGYRLVLSTPDTDLYRVVRRAD